MKSEKIECKKCKHRMVTKMTNPSYNLDLCILTVYYFTKDTEVIECNQFEEKEVAEPKITEPVEK